EDEAGGALRPLLEADVEPDGRVERRELVDEDRLQLGLERVGLLVGREVAVLAPPRGHRVHDPADHLPHGALPLRRAHPPTEVLLRDDVGRRLRPELRKLNVLLLEDRLVLAGDEGVAGLPVDLVERVAARDREVAADGEAGVLSDDRVLDYRGLDLVLCARHAAPPKGSWGGPVWSRPRTDFGLGVRRARRRGWPALLPPVAPPGGGE